MADTSITLRGEITSATIEGGVLAVEVDLGQELPAQFSIRLIGSNNIEERLGQNMLSGLCHALGIMRLADSKQLVGRLLVVRVIQPVVAHGLLQPLVVVGFNGEQK